MFGVPKTPISECIRKQLGEEFPTAMWMHSQCSWNVYASFAFICELPELFTVSFIGRLSFESVLSCGCLAGRRFSRFPRAFPLTRLYSKPPPPHKCYISHMPQPAGAQIKEKRAGREKIMLREKVFGSTQKWATPHVLSAGSCVCFNVCVGQDTFGVLAMFTSPWGPLDQKELPGSCSSICPAIFKPFSHFISGWASHFPQILSLPALVPPVLTT